MLAVHGEKTSKNLQKITHRLHAHRALLVPSLMLRMGYLEKVHMSGINSEIDAIQGKPRRLKSETEYLKRQMETLRADITMPEKEYGRRVRQMLDADSVHAEAMQQRLRELKAMQKQTPVGMTIN